MSADRRVVRRARDRAARTHDAFVDEREDRVRPHWLERQLDPRSPAFVASSDLALLANVTLRNWTTIGTLDAASTAIVDPRGLLTPRVDGWSLDWWIGAEDRWHFPSREAAVRQQLVDDAPVVETAMRIPGGDAVQRVYAVPGPEGSLAIVEITNRTPTPFAVALAVRPYHAEGSVSVERIGLRDTTVVVDGRPALLLPKRPQRVAASTAQAGDVVHVVTSGAAGTELPDEVRCTAGGATAAFLFPLAHTATLRVAVPLEGDTETRSRWRRRGAPLEVPRLPTPVPDSDAVVRGWQAQTGSRGMRLVLPEGRLASAVEANRRALLLFREPTPALTGALDRYGFHQESSDVLAALAARQRTDGSFASDDADGGDATGAALHAVAEHRRLTGSSEGIVAERVLDAVRWIERKRPPAAQVGEDDRWSLRGLLDGAELLRALGDEGRAAEVEGWATARRVPTVIDAADVVRERSVVGSAVYDPQRMGLSPSRTLELAEAELAAGDRRCLERLTWLVESATTTFTWPTAIHPSLGGGCAGDGHDAEVTAGFLTLVRHLLVREVGEDGLALCSVIPEAWAGQAIEVHDAPTHHGLLSFAIRWHGDRPALLWDLRRRDGDQRTGPVHLTAPGLDPAWSTDEPKGEALLAAGAAPPPPRPPEPAPEGSFS